MPQRQCDEICTTREITTFNMNDFRHTTPLFLITD